MTVAASVTTANTAHRGVHAIAATTLRQRTTPSKKRGLGAWLAFRREKVPGTAPIAFPDTTKQAAGARAAWSQSFPLPPRDHAARATLGRRVQPGVPEGRNSGTSQSATPTW